MATHVTVTVNDEMMRKLQSKICRLSRQLKNQKGLQKQLLKLTVEVAAIKTACRLIVPKLDDVKTKVDDLTKDECLIKVANDVATQNPDPVDPDEAAYNACDPSLYPPLHELQAEWTASLW